jgi:hypothetical protein
MQGRSNLIARLIFFHQEPGDGAHLAHCAKYIKGQAERF